MRSLIKMILIAMLLGLECTKTYAHDFEVDGLYYNIVSISDLTCEVTYRGTDYYDARFTYSGDIVVPEVVEYNGRTLKVVGVGDNAFDNYDWWNKKKEPITSISLPDDIEYLGDNALAYNSITDFIVPLSLRKVGSGAFKSNSIKRVYIKSMKSWCEILFQDDKSSPFCNGKRNEGSAVTFGLYTTEGELYLNGTLCETVSIPYDIKTINNYAFAGVASLKEVIIPEGIESIGVFAFANCLNLASIKTPSTCKSVGMHAFNGCGKLCDVQLSDGLERLGERSFSYCASLRSLTFPSTLKTIGEYLFYGMNLPSLAIDHSEQALFLPESSLFNINSIYFQRDFYCSYWWKKNGSSPFGEIARLPFKGYEDGYKNVLKTIVIGPSVTNIPRKIFEECSLDSVIIQDSDTPILFGYERADSSYSTWLGHITSNYYKCSSTFHSVPIKYLKVGRPIEVNYTELYDGATQEGADYQLYGYFEKSNEFDGIEIGNSVSDISFFDFAKYKDLKTISLGKNIVSVPDLSNNEYLESIMVINDTPPNAIAFANTTYLHCNLFIPKGCKDAYESADVWKNFWNIIELEQDFNTLGIGKQNFISETDELARYTIDGTKISSPKRGLNIVIMSDGTSKKVIVK